MVQYGGGVYSMGGRRGGLAAPVLTRPGRGIEVEVVAPCLRMGRDGMGKGLGGMRGTL